MTELIVAGVELMLIGMGIVYAFLAMLIGAIHFMAGAIARYCPEAPVMEKSLKSGTDKAIVAAITMAVHQYRSKHQ